ncbi:hypothetical protein Agub_g1911 [Astrephomene gubernaculifera]|uniref:Uncharacterized protein n=1 Tax=Astrephomene gubernaculifera TaxID=47775 RepID=A0AAD3HHV3_9CHLO|nr:hypothetical protein Agub_g1911 [Astrephomene gubernaculifera]
MSAGGKLNGTIGTSARTSRPNPDAARKWVAEETRAEAKEVFAQHMKETSNLDVLSRCKKLNELLSSDVLRGKGNSTAQIKEILGILQAGPKRPAFLDKPPVTATAGKRSSPSGTTPEKLAAPPPSRDIVYPDTLLSLLEDEEEPPPPSRAPPLAATLPQQHPDDMDDLIHLLNEPWSDAQELPVQLPLSSPLPRLPPQQEQQVSKAAQGAEQRRDKVKQANDEAQRQQKARQAQEEEERARKARKAAEEEAERLRQLKEAEEGERLRKQREKEEADRVRKRREAEEAERARKQQEEEEAERLRRQREAEEAERRRKAEIEEAERQRAAAAAAEALRLERLRHNATLCIQTQWRAFCARRLVAQVRRQREEERALAAAACVLQAAWRTRQAACEHRALLAAAGTMQCAVRAWLARRCMQRLCVEAFVRKRAACTIQRAFRAYRARGYTLGPLRVPTRPATSQGCIDGAALLAMQLRLRSAVDARLAPERTVPASGSDSARQHRTVLSHRERVRQVSASERHRRSGVSERAIMAASEHRDNDEALAIARQGLAVSLLPPPAPTLPRVPTGDGTAAPPSRNGSRPTSQGSGRPQAAAAAADVTSTAVLRPSSSQRRRSSSIGAPANPV